MDTQHALVDHLIRTGMLASPQIVAAFQHIDRRDFLPEEYTGEIIYADRPLMIGYEQTISQPSVVAFMLELLDPQVGDRVLDVGSGTGWTTALLAQIVGKTGHVFGVELVSALVARGAQNLAKYHFTHATIMPATDTYGLPQQGPYDRILVSATSMHIPPVLIDQLAIDGVLVMPVHHDIVRYQKSSNENATEEMYGGYNFVPLIDPQSVERT